MDPVLDYLLKPRRFQDLWAAPTSAEAFGIIPDDGKSALERMNEGLIELDKIGLAPSQEIHAREWGFFKNGRYLEGKGYLVISPMPFGRLGIQLVPRNDEVLKHLLKEEGIEEKSPKEESQSIVTWMKNRKSS